jgi:hypothetical protein
MPRILHIASLRAAALHVVIAALASFPMLLSPRTRLVGHEDVDVWNHAWGAWWYWTSLSHLEWPYFTGLLMAPRSGPLWYIDPIGALTSCWLVPLSGAIFAYNAWIFAALALASLAARRLALQLGASDAASWISSLVLCCSPALISEVHNGVSEAVGVAWSLFALTAAWRACESGRWRDWGALGLWGGVCAVGSYYYAVATGLVVGIWALLAGVRILRRAQASRSRDLARLLLGLLIALVLTSLFIAPVAWLVHRSVDDLNAIVMRGAMRPEDLEMLLAHNAVDPRTFLWPGDFQSVDLAARGEAFRHSSYLGIVALALALSTRSWKVLAAIAVSVLFGLGPWLWWGGQWVELPSGARLALPFRFLLHMLPGSAATHPQRMALPAIALVGALAALRASGWRRPLQGGLALLVAAEGLLVGPSPWPLARTPELDFEAHEALGHQPGREYQRRRSNIVLDLPVQVGETMTTSRYLLYQTVSGLPIPYRPDAVGGTSSLMGVPSFWRLALPSTSRREHRAVMETNLAKLGEESPPDPLELVQQGVAWIVVHRELERGEQNLADIESVLEAWYGPPRLYGTHAVYDTWTAVRAEEN